MPATVRALNEMAELNLHRREWGRALENLKRQHGLPNDHHGIIYDTADYEDAFGWIDNMMDYL